MLFEFAMWRWFSASKLWVWIQSTFSLWMLQYFPSLIFLKSNLLSWTQIKKSYMQFQESCLPYCQSFLIFFKICSRLTYLYYSECTYCHGTEVLFKFLQVLETVFWISSVCSVLGESVKRANQVPNQCQQAIQIL